MECKPGDVVRLKSGGPPMTVETVEKKGQATIATCLWFDERQCEDGEFAVSVLVPAEPDGAPAEVPAPEPAVE